jgi:hypothetical protein
MVDLTINQLDIDIGFGHNDGSRQSTKKETDMTTMTDPQRKALTFAFAAWVDNLWDDLHDGGDHDPDEIATWETVAERLADQSIPVDETGILDHLDPAVDAVWIALGGTDPITDETSDVWPDLNLDDLAAAASALGIWDKVRAEQGLVN